MHASPQAVFTSFKLPKPGSNSGSSLGAEPPLLPVRFSSPSTPPNSVSASGKKVMSAPLGGLPAMASQLAQVAGKSEDEEEPSTPSPSKKQQMDDSPSRLGLIKAKGTYYPLTAFPTSMPQGPVMSTKPEAPNSPNSDNTSTAGKGTHKCQTNITSQWDSYLSKTLLCITSCRHTCPGAVLK